MSGEVEITRESQLRELAAQLGPGSSLEADLRQVLRDAATPVVREVQNRLRALTITGDGEPKEGHTMGRGALRRKSVRGNRRPLRATVAEVIKTRTDPQGVIIEVDQYALPREMISLPKHLEAKKGWRHPTFGRKSGPRDWHNERGGPWFYSTIRDNRPKFDAALDDGLERAVQKSAQKVRSA